MSGARKGRRHGAAMMVWMFFANLFDPKAAVATEAIDTQRRSGGVADRTVRAAAAPPVGDDR
ncbi:MULTISPECIES: hypothetical protein [unclassified Sphingomonas]|jgi:hypothetical protein|uniref:hypothetical protein n=1 Tax=unclassified Sphingomonas TaxID=196159 RepID=UPI000E100B1A|nr:MULTISPECIES: hypothetical protein [unclassified Sphingomonas]AXJ95248.1 hypothetical protein DM480_06755 [Sphingomonas sp. FARSPH]